MNKKRTIMFAALLSALLVGVAFAIIYTQRSIHFNISIESVGEIRLYDVGTTTEVSGFDFASFNETNQAKYFYFDLVNTGSKDLNFTWILQDGSGWTLHPSNSVYENGEFAVRLFFDDTTSIVYATELNAIAKGERVTLKLKVEVHSIANATLAEAFDTIFTPIAE